MWFQVQEELIEHPKTTKLRKTLGCSQLEAAGVILAIFTRGIRQATKDGDFISDDRDDIARYLVFANAGSKLDGNKVVDALISIGWLEEHNNVLSIHDWNIWQSALYSAMERRSKDTERKRLQRAMKAESKQESLFDEADPTPPPPPDVGGSEEKPKYSPEFEEFWEEYPRKIDKGNAYKKYQARRKDGFSAQDLLEAAKAYSVECKRKGTDKEYIKHPKTFLSDATPFIDYIPKKPAITLLPGENPFKREVSQYG